MGNFFESSKDEDLPNYWNNKQWHINESKDIFLKIEQIVLWTVLNLFSILNLSCLRYIATSKLCHVFLTNFHSFRFFFIRRPSLDLPLPLRVPASTPRRRSGPSTPSSSSGSRTCERSSRERSLKNKFTIKMLIQHN